MTSPDPTTPTGSLHAHGTYDGTVERTADGGVIRFERHLGYPIGEVWRAITEPSRLADWWLPGAADISVDLREGGHMTFVMHPADEGGDPMTLACEVLRVDPPHVLEHTHADPDSLMRWELRSVATGTVLRLTHRVTDVAAAIDRCYVVGLHTSLSRLEPLLAGHPIEWDWASFASDQAAYAELGLAPLPEAGSSS